MRAGQVSVEYLTTYGWVIIVVLFTLSALYQYDVFAPSRLTKPTCDLGTQLVCQDAYLDTGGQFRMLIVNTFIEKVNINRLTFLREEAVVCTLPAIEPSTQGEVLCTLDLDTSPNEGRTVAFTLFFRRNETGAQVYNVSGMIHTRVQTPRLIAPPLCEQLSGHECGSTETCRGTELDDRTPGVCCQDPCATAQCSNNIDDNGDGTCDLATGTCTDGSTPGDPDCAAPNDDDETM